MSNDTLKIQIDDLKKELDQKNEEINTHLDRIDYLENNIMQLEDLIQEGQSTGKIDTAKYQNVQAQIQLEEKDKEIRTLKNNLGFLRKEKMALQKELDEKDRDESHTYSVMERDKDNEPLHTLIKELQSKINKQQSLISELKSNKSSNKSSSLDFENKLSEKEKLIKDLESEITNLKAELKLSESAENKKNKKTISSSLTEMLQEKLNNTRKKVEILEKKLAKYENTEAKAAKSKDESDFAELKTQIIGLQNQLKHKDDDIKVFKKTVLDLEEAQSKIARDLGSGVISSLTDELQRRLNKAKYYIRSLETKLERYENSSKLEEELDALKIKVKSQDVLLKEKEENLIIIKKEATKSNEEITKLKKYIDAIKGHSNLKIEVPQEITPNVKLRISELKILVKELEKKNAEQRLEITQLRKS